MTSEQFTYWLNGYFELSGAEELNKDQVKIIKDHIKLVLTKVTPSVTIGSQWYPASVPSDGKTGITLTPGILEKPQYPQKVEITCETKNEQPQTNKLVMSDADHFLKTHFVRNR